MPPARKPAAPRTKAVSAQLALLKRRVNAIARNFAPEVKLFDASETNQSATSSGTVKSMTAIAAGTDQGQRTGNRIKTKYLNVKMQFYPNTAATQNSVRFMIVRDNDPMGAIPGVSDVLASVAQFTAINAPYNPISVVSKRFTVLYDKRFELNDATRVDSWGKFSRRMSKEVSYSGTLGTDELNGHIYAMYISDSTANHPGVSWYSRLGYTDA